MALLQSQRALVEERGYDSRIPSTETQSYAKDSTLLATELIERDLVKFCPTIW